MTRSQFMHMHISREARLRPDLCVEDIMADGMDGVNAATPPNHAATVAILIMLRVVSCCLAVKGWGISRKDG